MLSVIIPTRNRAYLLKLALQSLQKQTLPLTEFEVLVIDNGSTDNTKQIVTSFQQQLSSIRYFFDDTPGLHVGRHRGLKEAKSEVLVFADDDIQATPTWLEAIAENFTDESVMMLGGNNYPDFKAPVPEWLEALWQRPVFGGRAITSLSILDLPTDKHDCNPHLVWGCNFSIRKKVILEAGGFHPDGIPQELIHFRGDGESYISHFVEQHNLRCVFDPRASVYHAVTPERMTLEYFEKRAYNQGISDSYTQLRNMKSLSSSLSLLTAMKIVMKRILKKSYGKLQLLKPNNAALVSISQKGYWRGYDYHQKMYQQNPKLKAWVHQANYY